MSSPPFRVRHIDHVELYVPDQREAAAWYRQVFGLEVLHDYEHWAANGPLMISADGGATKLALFQGDPPGFTRHRGFQRVAFNVDGPGFLQFLQRLDRSPVFDHDGRQVHTLDAVDHDLSFSVYFCDPYGNRYEITTYDYEQVKKALGG